MPAFSYQAIDPQGVTQRGVLEADSARAVRSQLRARHLVPLDVAPVVSGTQTRDIVLWQRRVLNQTALTIWTRQLAGLVDAGLPLERALTALADEAATPRQQALVAALRAEVNAGSPFAQALAAHPAEFSPMGENSAGCAASACAKGEPALTSALSAATSACWRGVAASSASAVSARSSGKPASTRPASCRVQMVRAVWFSTRRCHNTMSRVCVPDTTGATSKGTR